MPKTEVDEEEQKQGSYGITGLIEALEIFKKYGNPIFPTSCSHDELMVHIDPAIVTQVDKDKLELLGFFQDEDIEECFGSFVYGSS